MGKNAGKPVYSPSKCGNSTILKIKCHVTSVFVTDAQIGNDRRITIIITGLFITNQIKF